MRQLTAKQRRLVAALLQGYTEREISAQEGVSQQAVHQQWLGVRQTASRLLQGG